MIVVMPMEKLEFEVIRGTVIAKANHYQVAADHDGRRRIIKDNRVRGYERLFAKQCHVYRDRFIDKPFFLYIRVFFPNASCDLDNSLKTVLDCMQQCRCIKDDSLCTRIFAEKCIDKKNPRLQFAILETQPKLF